MLQIHPLTLGLYQTNCYIVHKEGVNRCLVIDPGYEANTILNRAAVLGLEIEAILLTHGHFDHMLSAQPLSKMTGAPVYVHAGDQEMLCNEELNAYNAEASYQPSPVDFEADELEESISAAGLEFKVLHTPGHTPGSVCFYDEENAVLFSGDTLFCAGFGRMDLPGGSAVQMRTSLRKLFALPGNTRVLCGHGYETTIQDERARYRL